MNHWRYAHLVNDGQGNWQWDEGAGPVALKGAGQLPGAGAVPINARLLNDAGARGWELVSCFHEPNGWTAYVFKRPTSA